MPQARIETRAQDIWLDERGIAHALTKPHVDLSLIDAEEAVRAIASLCSGKKLPVLVDLCALKSISREARLYFAGAETAKFEAAAALLTKSPLTKAIGNFFMGLNRPLVPTRVFTSEDEATAWLSGFLA